VKLIIVGGALLLNHKYGSPHTVQGSPGNQAPGICPQLEQMLVSMSPPNTLIAIN